MTQSLGPIAELRRFPVKSMLGERCDQLMIERAGAVGDRCCAVIDMTSAKLASAKRPAPWRTLLTMTARLAGDEVEIDLSDGSMIRSDSPDCDSRLSAVVGRDVRLIRARDRAFEIDRADPDDVAERGVEGEVSYVELTIGQALPAGGFADFAPIHLLSTASLARVAEVISPAEAERFRANLLIDNQGAQPFAENDWIGRRIAIGEQLVLRVIEPTPRCAIPTLAHGPLPANPRLTQIIGTLNKASMTGMPPLACLGAYAIVEQPGIVSQGDAARLID